MEAFRSPSPPMCAAFCAAGLALVLAAGANAQVRVDVTPLVTDDPTAHAGQIVDPGLVAPTIASTLGLNETSRSLATEALVLHLRDRRALLVLDNFEQVLSAAPMLGCLLVDAPGTQILVTSRAPLDLPEERIYPVPPLQLADASQPLELARLRETEAIRLFVDRDVRRVGALVVALGRALQPQHGSLAARERAVRNGQLHDVFARRRIGVIFRRRFNQRLRSAQGIARTSAESAALPADAIALRAHHPHSPVIRRRKT